MSTESNDYNFLAYYMLPEKHIKLDIAVSCEPIHHSGKSHTIWDHSVTCHPAEMTYFSQNWYSI